MKKKVQIVICLDAKNNSEVLLFKTNKKRGAFWQNITGSVDPGEDFYEGAVREVFEESSIKISEDDLIDLKMDFKFKSQWGDEVTEKCFLLKLKKKTNIKIDSSEHDEFKWLKVSEVNESTYKFPSNFEAFQKALKC